MALGPSRRAGRRIGLGDTSDPLAPYMAQGLSHDQSFAAYQYGITPQQAADALFNPHKGPANDPYLQSHPGIVTEGLQEEFAAEAHAVQTTQSLYDRYAANAIANGAEVDPTMKDAFQQMAFDPTTGQPLKAGDVDASTGYIVPPQGLSVSTRTVTETSPGQQVVSVVSGQEFSAANPGSAMLSPDDVALLPVGTDALPVASSGMSSVELLGLAAVAGALVFLAKRKKGR